MTRSMLTRSDLDRWVDNGATWQIVKPGAEPVLVQLCTCYGEAVDVVQAAPDLARVLRSGELSPRAEQPSK